MNVHFEKKRIPMNEERFDPHRYWVFLLSFFFLGLACTLAYFSWYFVHVASVLDAPPTPFLESNAAQITVMQRRIKTVDDAIAKRANASQNPSAVVQ